MHTINLLHFIGFESDLLSERLNVYRYKHINIYIKGVPVLATLILPTTDTSCVCWVLQEAGAEVMLGETASTASPCKIEEAEEWG